MLGTDEQLAALARDNPAARWLLARQTVPALAQARRWRLTIGAAALGGLVIVISGAGFFTMLFYGLLLLGHLLLPLVVATRTALFVALEVGRPEFDLLRVTPLLPQDFAQAFARVAFYRARLWFAAGYGLLPALAAPLLLNELFWSLRNAGPGYDDQWLLIVLFFTVGLFTFALGPLALSRTALVIGARVGVYWRRSPWLAVLLAPFYTLLTGAVISGMVYGLLFCVFSALNPALFWASTSDVALLLQWLAIVLIPAGMHLLIVWLIGVWSYRSWLISAQRALLVMSLGRERQHGG